MIDCLFCKIASGETPSYKIYENDNFLIFLDIYPKCIGHTLIIPKKHSSDILSIDSNLYSEMMMITKNLSVILKDILDADGIKIVSNNGAAAGQEVFHTHVHIMPYYNRKRNLANYKNDLSKFHTKVNILIGAQGSEDLSIAK